MIQASTSSGISSPEEILQRGRTAPAANLYDDPSNIAFQIRDAVRNPGPAKTTSTPTKSAPTIGQRLKLAGQQALPDNIDIEEAAEAYFYEDDDYDEDDEIDMESFTPVETPPVRRRAQIKPDMDILVATPEDHISHRIEYLEKLAHLAISEIEYLQAQMDYNDFMENQNI